MRYLAIALATLTAFACGSETPTDSSDNSDPAGPVAAVTVESGDGQKAPPRRALPDSIVGRVTDSSGNPISGQIVNFQVAAGDSAGSFEVDALQTNSEGRVFNELTTGIRAWTARVAAGEDSAYTARLVASREGRPDEVARLNFAVEPAEATEFPEAGFSRFDPDSVERWPDPARDRFGNPALQRVVVSTADSFPVVERGERRWVQRPSAEVVAVQGDTPGTVAARTIEELVLADERAFAVVCLRAGTADQDSIVGVALAETGANMGLKNRSPVGTR